MGKKPNDFSLDEVFAEYGGAMPRSVLLNAVAKASWQGRGEGVSVVCVSVWSRAARLARLAGLILNPSDGKRLWRGGRDSNPITPIFKCAECNDF